MILRYENSNLSALLLLLVILRGNRGSFTIYCITATTAGYSSFSTYSARFSLGIGIYLVKINTLELSLHLFKLIPLLFTFYNSTYLCLVQNGKILRALLTYQAIISRIFGYFTYFTNLSAPSICSDFYQISLKLNTVKSRGTAILIASF